MANIASILLLMPIVITGPRRGKHVVSTCNAGVICLLSMLLGHGLTL